MDASSTPQVLNASEQLFIYSVIIFALMFPVWDILFRPVKRIYDRRGTGV